MDATLFVRRPVLAVVLSLVIVLLGAVAFFQLPVRETPDVQSPVVTVSTSWPGADPALVETQVTEVLEKQLNGIEGVREIRSTSQDQNSSITVEFELGRELEEAANDVRSRVSRARRQLPDDVDEPVVEKADSNAQPVMFLRLMSKSRSLLELNEIADTLVRERIQSATGVSGVEIQSEQRFAMRVELDPAKMAARGLTPGDVEAAFRAQNVDLPAGRVEGQRVDLGIRLDGAFRTPEEFEAMIVSDTGAGLIRLGDVADVRLGSHNERQAARADGEAAVTLSITPQANANIIDLSDAVRERLPRVQADLPPDVQLVEQYDRAEAVRASIYEVEETLLIAFGLVVVVIFAFLRDWRSTLVPTLAIPVSIIGTFFALWIFGFSINVFTLFGLVLAIGLVVDDAIVVLENVYRRMEEGESPAEAASKGTQQIQFAVIATTVSLIAVFLPVIFTGGTSGKLFVEFGTTVAVSVAISAVVALSLTPMLCAWLLKPHGQKRRGALWNASEAVLQGMNRAFAWSLAFTLRRKWIVLPMILGSLAAGLVGYRVLPREFFPVEDRNIFFVRIVAPEGTTFEYLDERMAALEPTLMEGVPELRALLTRVSSGGGGSQAAGNSGTFVFPLLKPDERAAAHPEGLRRTQQDIVAAVRGLLARETAFQAIPIQFPTVGRSFSPPVQIVLLHPEFEQLADALPRAVAATRKVEGLSAVNEDLKLNRPELRAVVDREKAAAAGISMRDLARALQIVSAGADVSDFKRGTRQYDVYAGLPRALRDTPEALRLVSLRARDGSMVPLGNLVHFEERSAASSRYHFDRSPSATISANLDGITLGEGIERARAAVEAEVGEGFRIALAGESRDFAEASSSLLAVFGLALVLVYLTLAAQFDSFVDPISILLAVPLALTGAFAGLAILGMTLSFFSQVGLILLVGLVTKNGILIVEYAHQLMRDEQLPLWKAAEEATKLRFRPILMTSIATIGGALPIAIGFSGASRAPLGVAVVAGMAVATVLTLYVVPVAWGVLARKHPAPVAADAADRSA
ncbi:MAG: efflux RND transporter permease subunit [Myxococcota bacterium]